MCAYDTYYYLKVDVAGKVHLSAHQKSIAYANALGSVVECFGEKHSIEVSVTLCESHQGLYEGHDVRNPTAEEFQNRSYL